MESALLLLRLLLAAIFALAGIAKFLDLKGSEKAFKDFGVPGAFALPGSIALSILEIGIAFLLLSRETAWFGAAAALFLLLLFIGQMIYQMAKGNAPDCHCFGQLHSEPVGKKSVVRNIVFAILSAILVMQGRENQGLSLADRSLDVMQLVFGIAVVGFLGAVIFYLRKISEQQTQIMRRIELMELVASSGGSVERDDAGHPHEGLPIGAVFPDLSLPDLSGTIVTLDDLRAYERAVLFVFVSPTCNPCRALVPEFERWQSELDGKVNLVFISNGTPEENREKFGGDASKQILLQQEREVAELVRAQWTPTALLMDSKGRVASHVAAGDSAIRTLVEQISGEDLGAGFKYFTNGTAHSHSKKIGSNIPDFSVEDINGNEVSTGFFHGKQTLVAFWSPGCPFCREMMVDLREWDKTKGPGAPSLIVFSDGERDELREYELLSPVILDEGHKTAAGFGMFGTPSAVLVNEQGQIISETAIGAPDIWSLIGKRK